MLEGVGTVRNKLGDVHGRGPTPSHVGSLDHAEHLLLVTAAHMLFLAKLVGMR